jgi:hypothetical protein
MGRQLSYRHIKADNLFTRWRSERELDAKKDSQNPSGVGNLSNSVSNKTLKYS